MARKALISVLLRARVRRDLDGRRDAGFALRLSPALGGDEADEDVLERRLPRGQLEKGPAARDGFPEDRLPEVGPRGGLQDHARLPARTDAGGTDDAGKLPEDRVGVGQLALQRDREA